MRRDNDLIRQCLLFVEASDDPVYLHILTDGSSVEDRRTYFHLKLLADAGMLEETGRYGGHFRITNHGHDFLEAIRSETRWVKVKGVASSAGGLTLGIMFDVAKELLLAEVKSRVGGAG